MTQYKLIEHKNNDAIYTIQLTDGKYSGIIYEYGKVELTPFEQNGEEAVKLSFDYTIHNEKMNVVNGVVQNEEFDKVDFEQTIGEILSSLIEEGVQNNSIVYSGGVDENRENDSSESAA
jgi:hypothetical protein